VTVFMTSGPGFRTAPVFRRVRPRGGLTQMRNASSGLTRPSSSLLLTVAYSDRIINSMTVPSSSRRSSWQPERGAPSLLGHDDPPVS